MSVSSESQLNSTNGTRKETAVPSPRTPIPAINRPWDGGGVEKSRPIRLTETGAIVCGRI
jgi:hypothetical protein